MIKHKSMPSESNATVDIKKLFFFIFPEFQLLVAIKNKGVGHFLYILFGAFRIYSSLFVQMNIPLK